MSNYKEQIAEFENNFSNVIDKSVRELSASFDTLYSEKNNKEIPSTIKLAEALLSDKQNTATKMQIHFRVILSNKRARNFVKKPYSFYPNKMRKPVCLL